MNKNFTRIILSTSVVICLLSTKDRLIAAANVMVSKVTAGKISDNPADQTAFGIVIKKNNIPKPSSVNRAAIPFTMVAPAISYPATKTYSVGTAIAPLIPVNSGGAIPVAVYANVTTIFKPYTVKSTLFTTVNASGQLYLTADGSTGVYTLASMEQFSIYCGSGNGYVNGASNVAKFSASYGLVCDSAGNIYMCDMGNNMIRKINTDRVASLFAGQLTAGSVNGTGSKASFKSPRDITIDASGNLYVTDYNNNMIRKITPGGTVSTLAGSPTPGFADGAGSAASFNHPYGISVSPSGNIYVADFGNNSIRMITPAGVVTTVAGSLSPGYTDGIGNAARFNQPESLVCTGGGIYVADYLNNCIRRVSYTGEVVTVAGSIVEGSKDGIGVNAQFSQPKGLSVSPDGNLYISDSGNWSIRKMPVEGYSVSPALPAGLTLDIATGIISGTPQYVTNGKYVVTAINSAGSSSVTLNLSIVNNQPAPNISYKTPPAFHVGKSISAVSPVNAGGLIPKVPYRYVNSYLGTPMVVNTSASDSPVGVAVDASGSVYIPDRNLNVIRKVTNDGRASIFAGSGRAGFINGTGTAAAFNNPRSIIIDSKGNLFVADCSNNMIRKITATGVVSTFAGSGAVGSVNDQGIGASFNAPTGIAIDKADNIYVADNANIIRKVDPLGNVTTIAITGPAANFGYIMNLAVDPEGNIYATDYQNNVVRKITPSGVASILAGNGSTTSSNGQGTAAGIVNPYGIAVDGKSGNVYVSDGNYYIRKITPDGIVSFFAGNGVPGYTNGIGATAKFYSPAGMAIDGNGRLYVADCSYLVRTIATVGYTIDKQLPLGLIFDGGTGTISGTPTVTSLSTDYHITGYSINGNSTATVNIVVAGPPPAPLPFGIHYNPLNVFTPGVTIQPFVPWVSSGSIPATTYGQVTTLAGSTVAGSANGTGTAAGLKNPFGTAVDTAGNVYFADFGNNLIRKITTAGVVSTIAGSGSAGHTDGTGIAASFNNPLSVVLDKHGNLFVADGANNMIRKITPSGAVSTFAGGLIPGATNATGTAARFNYPHGMAIDSAGNIYVADYSNNLIRKITSAGLVTTLAGTGKGGSTNGSGSTATFNGPYGVAVDVSGIVYVADKGNNKIRKIASDGTVSTLAGSGAVGALNATGTAATFNGPLSVVAGGGNIYVCDAGNNLIRSIALTGAVSTVAGQQTAGAVNGIQISAQFNNPHGIAIDTAGNLYVADYGNNQIRKICTTGYTISSLLPSGLSFDGKTGMITGTPTAVSDGKDHTVTGYNSIASSSSTFTITIANTAKAPNISYTTPNVFVPNVAIKNLVPANSGSAVPALTFGQTVTFAGTGSPGAVNGNGTGASFYSPYATAVDGGGNIYVADTRNQMIRKITPAGTVTTLAGSGTVGSADGTGSAANFNTPSGIAVDVSGNVYVTDKGNNLIRKITPSGVVTTFAGRGSIGSSNGDGYNASFNSPWGLATDNYGNLIVGDYGNNLIRKITPGGTVSTLAGTGAAGSVNGNTVVASFKGPIGVAVDASGNIYVADKNNNLIRKISVSGVVSTLAGSGAAGSANGTGTVSAFNGPLGIAVDKGGNVFVSDFTSSLIRAINPTGKVSTVAGSTAGHADGTGTSASFSSPAGLSIDASGNLNVADFGNSDIRKVITRGFTIDQLLPSGLNFDATTGIISGTPFVTSPATNYLVSAYNSGGSGSAIVSIAVQNTATLVSPFALNEPSVKSAMSPNGDGENDVLAIDNIEKYPDNRLMLMDAGGVKVFETIGYNNSSKVFDGHSSVDGRLQKAGTYFYVLEYKDSNVQKRKTGYVILKY